MAAERGAGGDSARLTGCSLWRSDTMIELQRVNFREIKGFAYDSSEKEKELNLLECLGGQGFIPANFVWQQETILLSLLYI
jgi:hypothetical protein